MSIKVEFEFQTVDDVAVFFARISPLYSVPAPEPAAVTQVHLEIAPARVEAVAAKPKKAKKAEPAEVVEPLTQADVRAALAAFLASKGIDGCTAVLKKYGVARVSELAPTLYEAFAKECK